MERWVDVFRGYGKPYLVFLNSFRWSSRQVLDFMDQPMSRLQCQRTVMRLGIDILLIIKPRVHSIHQLLMFIDSRICRLLSTLINHHIPFLSTWNMWFLTLQDVPTQLSACGFINPILLGSSMNIYHNWLVISKIVYFPFHIWDNYSHWRTHFFQDGYCTTNQFIINHH